jgi:probable rRNA maturation factor
LLELLSLHHYELSLVLTGDSAIRELNRVFRKQDRSTDVLSFPQLEDPIDNQIKGPSRHSEALQATLGDVVISIETAERQAQRQGISAEARLRTLLIHGVLHLLGYDHESSRADARRMFAKERELLTALARRKGNLSSAVRIQRAERQCPTRALLAVSFGTTGPCTAY